MVTGGWDGGIPRGGDGGHAEWVGGDKWGWKTGEGNSQRRGLSHINKSKGVTDGR